PPGNIILIRNKSGRTLGVLFTQVRSAPRLGTKCGCAHYQVDDLTGGRPQMLFSGGSGDLVARRPRAPSTPRLILHRDPNEIPCLPSSYFTHPGGISLMDGEQVALTRWTRFAAVDLHHPALRWFNSATDIGDHFGLDLKADELPK